MIWYVKLQTKNNNMWYVYPGIYGKAVGSLIYLMIYTRPDLSYTVLKLTQYLSETQEQD